jgi:hypothetical protein
MNLSFRLAETPKKQFRDEGYIILEQIIEEKTWRCCGERAGTRLPKSKPGWMRLAKTSWGSTSRPAVFHPDFL